MSRFTFEDHVSEVRSLCDTARESGFEFKLVKGQLNQPSVEFWGCVLNGQGKRP